MNFSRVSLFLSLLLLAACASGPTQSHADSERTVASATYKVGCISDRGVHFRLVFSEGMRSLTICEGTTAGEDGCDKLGAETILHTHFVKTDNDGGLYQETDNEWHGNSNAHVSPDFALAVQNGETKGDLPGTFSYDYFSGAGHEGAVARKCSLSPGMY